MAYGIARGLSCRFKFIISNPLIKRLHWRGDFFYEQMTSHTHRVTFTTRKLSILGPCNIVNILALWAHFNYLCVIVMTIDLLLAIIDTAFRRPSLYDERTATDWVREQSYYTRNASDIIDTKSHLINVAPSTIRTKKIRELQLIVTAWYLFK